MQTGCSGIKPDITGGLLLAFLGTVFNDIVFNWLPFLEILVGLLLIIGVVPRLAGSITALLVAGFIVNNVWLLSQGRGYEPCTCFGVLDRIVGVELSTTQSLYLDVFLFVLSFAVVFSLKRGFFDINPWFLKVKKNEP